MIIANRPLTPTLKKLLAAQKDRRMTYIAAFPCQEGIVMCADTLEVVGEHKNYVEKIAIADNGPYSLAIGGAGFGDLIDCTTQEIVDRAKAEPPKTKAALRELIMAALKHVYEVDLPALVVPRQHRSPEYLVGAKTDDGFLIVSIKGRRILGTIEKGIVGFGSRYNIDLLKRLHKPSMSMQQAVLLGVYLTAQSKRLDDGVGGQTRVAVVTAHTASFDHHLYIENAERSITDFLRLTDELFFSSINIGIPPSKFPEIVDKFSRDVQELRVKFLRETAAIWLNASLGDPEYRGSPYAWIFPGASVSLSFGGPLAVHEETPEEIARRSELYKIMHEKHNELAVAQFEAMCAGREVLYEGQEWVQVRGTAGPIPASESS